MINPNIVKAVRINPTLKIVIEIGTSPKNPIIPEIRDSIITVNDVKVLILTPTKTEVVPQQPQSPQQQPPPPLACIFNHQFIVKKIYVINM